MKFTSIFCLKSRIREARREHGGGIIGPSKVKANPQGGNIFTPYMTNVPVKIGIETEHGSQVPQGPHVIISGQNFGNDFIPLFGPFMRGAVKRGKAKEAGKKPVKPKSAKPLKRSKGPAHKKLHANPHPILAECCKRILGGYHEAISATMVPAVTIAGAKKKESKFRIISSRFREAMPAPKGLPTRFRVVLIQEGMGNSNDSYYYTREALESAVDVFSGAKVYVDHPTMEEEEIRPERSTRDAIGHYENVSVEIESEGGQAMLCADLDILNVKDTELQRAQMQRAVVNGAKFPGKDFIGLSINASGPSQETPIDSVLATAPEGAKPKLIDAQTEGIETLKVVTKINRAVSCDLVTEAGAGGKILNILGGGDGQKTA